jgi:phytoene dehydrogenase-like protein
MQKSEHATYDAIVVGAGISGLVCACYLAKAGLKILVIEQHNKPGGYFTSFRRRGFLFDAAAHSFGNYRQGGHVKKILTDLGADTLINIKRYDPSDIVVTPDFQVTFSNNTHATISHLGNLFPKEKPNISRFFDFLTAGYQTEFSKLKNKTFGHLLNSFFTDPQLIGCLGFPVLGNGGLPPSCMHAFSGSKIFSEFIIDGGYYSEGGIQTLPNALVRIVERHNGKVIYRHLVKKILLKNNAVAGVKLDNNDTLRSRYVVSACDMTQTFRSLLGKKIIGEEIQSKLKTMHPSLSTFILYIAIKKPFKGLPLPGTNTWYLPHYDLDHIYFQMQKCNFEKIGAYMMRVSPDEKTLVAFFGVPFRTPRFWRNHKKNVAKSFLNRIEDLIPNLRKHIVYSDAASPSTLYRYTLNYKGASFGWAKTTSQTFDAIFTRTTFLKGLFLTGHWTSIGFGLPGTCYSGHDTAKRILRKEKII